VSWLLQYRYCFNNFYSRLSTDQYLYLYITVMLKIFYAPAIRIPLYIKFPEPGLLESRHLGGYVYKICDNTFWMFVNCKCILLELREKFHRRFPWSMLWTAIWAMWIFLGLIIDFNTSLSPILRHKLRIVVHFSKNILLFQPNLCVQILVVIPLLKHFECNFVCWVEN